MGVDENGLNLLWQYRREAKNIRPEEVMKALQIYEKLPIDLELAIIHRKGLFKKGREQLMRPHPAFGVRLLHKEISTGKFGRDNCSCFRGAKAHGGLSGGSRKPSAYRQYLPGKVINVLPGMQAAFVDIGLEKNAFLYVEDAYPNRVIYMGRRSCNKNSPDKGYIKRAKLLWYR